MSSKAAASTRVSLGVAACAARGKATDKAATRPSWWMARRVGRAVSKVMRGSRYKMILGSARGQAHASAGPHAGILGPCPLPPPCPVVAWPWPRAPRPCWRPAAAWARPPRTHRSLRLVPTLTSRHRLHANGAPPGWPAWPTSTGPASPGAAWRSSAARPRPSSTGPPPWA